MKEDDPVLIRSMCRTIREHGMHERVLVASFSHEAVLHFRRLCPEGGDVHHDARGAPAARPEHCGSGAPVIDRRRRRCAQAPEYVGGVRVRSPGVIAAARRLNLHVHTFTVNEQDDRQRRLDLGLDGLITDRPDRMRALVAPAQSVVPE